MFNAVLMALVAQAGVSGPTHPSVRVPLDVYAQQHKKLEALRAAARATAQTPAPVVGETTYQGRSDGKNLVFKLTLVAHFASNNTAFQSVPIIGRDVVIVSARSGGRAVALRAVGSEWVWESNTRGSATIEVDFVVPPRGPRGSIEYRFGVAESPVTHLVVDFATPGLSPQIAGAVKKNVVAAGGGTRLDALLKPTSAIHIVGLHDVEQNAGTRQAKVYAETHNLVSLLDESIELFSVIDFTILYSSQKKFRIALPAGYDIVSADGQGAFHYTVETIDHQPVLVGETAFGIRDHYEISLRLKRTLSADEKRIQLPLPKLFDVERDTGYVAIEIPGKLSVEDVTGEGVLPIDVRELPEAIALSAVSPVVRAFRYADKREATWAMVARYPVRALASGGVDELEATTVVTKDGRVMTDARFTLRNVLEQYLALELSEGETVESASIDGNPLKPSKDDRGRVLLPLVRSKRDGGRLVPFEVQIVYGGRVDPLTLVGKRSLRLPRLDVPISSLEWNVYVPGGYETTALSGSVGRQNFVKNASWHRSGIAVAGEEDQLELAAQGIIASRADGGTGAMPVRVKIPKRGQRLKYWRYWIDAGQDTAVSFSFVGSPLSVTWSALSAVLMGLGLLFAVMLVSSRGRMIGGLVGLATVGAGYALDVSVTAGIVIFVVLLLFRVDGVRRAITSVRAAIKDNVQATIGRFGTWVETRKARAAEKKNDSLAMAWIGELVGVTWLASRLMLLAGVSVWLMTRVAALLSLLGHPL